jgi:hypothetical protein
MFLLTLLVFQLPRFDRMTRTDNANSLFSSKRKNECSKSR